MIFKKKENRDDKKQLNSDYKIKQRRIQPKKETKVYSLLKIFLMLLGISVPYVLSFFLFKGYFSYKDINISDVNKANGTIEQYELKGAKTKTLYIKLDEYSEDFYIPANAINYESFEQNESKGNNINFLINKKDYASLQDTINKGNDSIEVYSISTDKNNYLEVKGFNDYASYQAKCEIVMGIIIMLFATFSLYQFIKVGKSML